MEVFVLALMLGAVLAAPLDQPVEQPGFDEAFPEEVPGLFEGDIELRPGENPFDRNALRDRSRRWPSGVVPYAIDTHAFHSSDQNTLRAAMAEIESKTAVHGRRCIHFVPHRSEHAYIKFVGGTGCHTPIGMGHGASGVTLGRGCMRKGTVIHEILHSLGFWHEQNRPDRDKYVTIHWENIQSAHKFNFNLLSSTKIDTLGEPYDYGSVMHYGAYSFAIDRRKPTISPKRHGVTIGQRIGLSGIDIDKIRKYYGCH